LVNLSVGSSCNHRCFAACPVKCQVTEVDAKWPYSFPCTDDAEFKIRLSVRQDHPEIVQEYICKSHAARCRVAFGNESVERLEVND
jgi:hypothetical protein